MTGTPPSGPDPRFLATATEIVLKAGEIQRAGQTSGFRIDKKGSIDLVTEVDLECERMCRAILRERFPQHDVLGEEYGSHASTGRDGRHRWIYDPLDGTTNYAHGLPIYCSSLALEVDGLIEVGAVYDPSRHELFTAERGVGAFMNGSRLHASSTVSLGDALLVTGFPYDVHLQSADLLELFGVFLTRARAVRRLGSAALDLCYVGAGRFDGFWEQHLKAWDVAAGALIAAEAGALVSGMDGGALDLNGGQILAANPGLHAQLLEVIAAFRRGRAR